MLTHPARLVLMLVAACLVNVSCARKEDPKAPIPRPEDALLNRGGLPRGGAPAAPDGSPADIPAKSVKEAMKPAGQPHVAETQDRPTFVMNKSLLGAMINDAAYRFQFAPPRLWKRFSKADIDASIGAVRPPAQSGFSAVPLYGFRDTASGAVLVVAALNLPAGVKDSSFVEQIDAYGPLVEAQFRPTPLQVSGFIKDALRIVQFRAQRKEQVIYRMVFSNKRKSLILLDFTLPRKSSPTSFRADMEEIEPVIASLDVLK